MPRRGGRTSQERFSGGVEFGQGRYHVRPDVVTGSRLFGWSEFRAGLGRFNLDCFAEKDGPLVWIDGVIGFRRLVMSVPVVVDHPFSNEYDAEKNRGETKSKNLATKNPCRNAASQAMTAVEAAAYLASTNKPNMRVRASSFTH